MIFHQNLTFQAKLKQGQLYIMDRSPDLPPFSDHTLLLNYLSGLSLDHFQVKQMTFEGFDLTVEMERMADESKPTPQYLVHILAQTFASPDMSFTETASRLKNRQQALNDDFSETIRGKGWSELAVSKPLANNFDGLYIVSIWRAQ